jgi:hypothetical protein
MATASKGNEEFIALAMVCRGHPQWNNRLEKGPKNAMSAIQAIGKIVHKSNAEDIFDVPCPKRAFRPLWDENSSVQASAWNRAGCILQSTGHWALGLHSCRALSSQRMRILQNKKLKFNVNRRRLFHLRQRMLILSNPRRLFYLRQQDNYTTRLFSPLVRGANYTGTSSFAVGVCTRVRSENHSCISL